MARHEVWDVVQRVKAGKVIILTTYNMEEADVLADRVAILSKGELKCIGNALHLKTKYGNGYRVTVVCSELVSLEQTLAAISARAPCTLIAYFCLFCCLSHSHLFFAPFYLSPAELQTATQISTPIIPGVDLPNDAPSQHINIRTHTHYSVISLLPLS